MMLKELGVSFVAAKSGFIETEHSPGESPGVHVKKMAAGKACTAARRYKNAFVIGADTVVVYRGRVLGKPASARQALEFLHMLNGRTHAVYTGLAIVDADSTTVTAGFEKTLVTFKQLTDAEERAYLASIQPMDKAGAYAIQGPGALIVKEIRGCYYNVVGFPLAKLEQMLLRHGVSLFAYMQDSRRAALGL